MPVKKDLKKAKLLRDMKETLYEMAAELNRLKIDKNSYTQMKLMETASILGARALLYENPPGEPKADSTGAIQEELPF